MRAKVGDWLVVHSRRVDDSLREGQILEVPHADGSPPYMVRWVDDDHVSLVFPNSDATVLAHRPHAGVPKNV
jgi:hypothetical protein